MGEGSPRFSSRGKRCSVKGTDGMTLTAAEKSEPGLKGATECCPWEEGPAAHGETFWVLTRPLWEQFRKPSCIVRNGSTKEKSELEQNL